MDVTQGTLEPKSRWTIGIATARFNWEITGQLEDGAYKRLLELGIKETQVRRIRVPGAVELSLTARLLLDGGCDAVIVLGAVIQGDTKHFDYVCNSVERGCTQVMLDTKKPVIFGVLTTNDEAQAFARVGGAHGHKGRDAAEVVVEMINLRESL